MDLKQNDIKILSELRKNSRSSLTLMSKNTGIPVSTIFDRINRMDNYVISKHSTLIDFNKLGFGLRAAVVLKSSKKRRKELGEFLSKSPQVNSLFRISEGFDFFADCIFRNMQELNEFYGKLSEIKTARKKEFFIINEIKSEEFLRDNLAGEMP